MNTDPRFAQIRDMLEERHGLGRSMSVDEAHAIAAAAAAGEPPPATVTHGRHCTCSACAREDWPSGRFVCGMHGESCPHEYQPIGPAGSVVP